MHRINPNAYVVRIDAAPTVVHEADLLNQQSAEPVAVDAYEADQLDQQTATIAAIEANAANAANAATNQVINKNETSRRHNIARRAKQVMGGLVAGAIGMATLGLSPASAATTESERSYEVAQTTLHTERLAGLNKTETAIKISQELNPNGDHSTLFFASANSFADALAAGPAAAKCGCAILLTDPAGLSKEVEAEALRATAHSFTGEKLAYILGGTGAVSENVVKQLQAKGFNVVRYGGVDRYQTSLLIAKGRFGTSAYNAYVVDGNNFVATMGASIIGSTMNHIGSPPGYGPVIMANGNKLSQEQIDYLKSMKQRTGATIYRVGKTGAYPQADVAIPGGDNPETYAEDLSIAIAQKAPGYRNGRVVLVKGDSYDAITGVAFATRNQGSMFMAKGGGQTQLSPSLRTFFRSEVAGEAIEGYTLGGTAVITTPLEQDFNQSIINQ